MLYKIKTYGQILFLYLTTNIKGQIAYKILIVKFHDFKTLIFNQLPLL